MMTTVWEFLRSRFAVLSIVGLAISVLSFAENLRMAQAAIRFVFELASKIDGLAAFLSALGALLHAALSEWRSAWAYLLSWLPFEIPKWLHDPLSLLFFSVTRGLSGAALTHAAIQQEQEAVDDKVSKLRRRWMVRFRGDEDRVAEVERRYRSSISNKSPVGEAWRIGWSTSVFIGSILVGVLAVDSIYATGLTTVSVGILVTATSAATVGWMYQRSLDGVGFSRSQFLMAGILALTVVALLFTPIYCAFTGACNWTGEREPILDNTYAIELVALIVGILATAVGTAWVVDTYQPTYQPSSDENEMDGQLIQFLMAGILALTTLALLIVPMYCGVTGACNWTGEREPTFGP